MQSGAEDLNRTKKQAPIHILQIKTTTTSAVYYLLTDNVNNN